MFIYKLVCLLMMTTASAASICPEGYSIAFKKGPMCYKKSPNQMNYDAAYRYCQAQGGEMVDKEWNSRNVEGKNHAARL